MPITDSELRRITSALFRKLPRLVADIFAAPISPSFSQSFSERAKQNLGLRLQRAIPLLKELEELDSLPLLPAERTRRFFDLLDKLLRTFSPARIPKRTHALEWLEASSRKLIQSSPPPSLRRTGFRRYMRALRRFLSRAKASGNLAKIYAFWEEMATHQGPYLIQPIFRKGKRQLLDRSLARVLDRKIPPRLDDADQLIEVYKMWGGLYEKHVALLAGFIELIYGREVSYVQMNRHPLAQNMRQLELDCDLAVISKGFDRVVRNAIAHENVQILGWENKIKFVDQTTSRFLSPAGLLKNVREAAAAVNALMLLPLLLTAEVLRLASRLRRDLGSDR